MIRSDGLLRFSQRIFRFCFAGRRWTWKEGRVNNAFRAGSAASKRVLETENPRTVLLEARRGPFTFGFDHGSSQMGSRCRPTFASYSKRGKLRIHFMGARAARRNDRMSTVSLCRSLMAHYSCRASTVLCVYPFICLNRD